jgi:Tfp pilus tip-associated adhesin PilY1
MRSVLISIISAAVLAFCGLSAAVPAYGANITVTSPNGGEDWMAGTRHQITWNYSGLSDAGSVKIELWKGGSLNLLIQNGAPIGTGGSGSFTWEVLAGQATGSDYKIKISSTSSSTDDSSNADFTITCHCNSPPFISSGLKPNVLIILDNSNSMDESFYGEAVGSYASTSKSVVAKNALKEITRIFKDKARVGLITYSLPSTSAYHIHNSPYFVSYEPKSYCPDPPDACVDYCRTDNETLKATLKATCQTECQSKNSLFDPDYFDEIITQYDRGSEQRNRYCGLVYPKTTRQPNPTDMGNYIYDKHAYPYYSSTDDGLGFCYSSTYSPYEGTPWDTYVCYHNKTGISDSDSGYSNSFFNNALRPTDSDYALGYYDFGKRLAWWHVGATWYANSSPGGGYIHVSVNDLTDDYGDNTTTYTSIKSKLDPKENDETGYMTCSSGNTCGYIVNAGLTPTAGTLMTAKEYLQGASSPIQDRCQKNFVVYVTDGLPSVNTTGGTGTAADLMPEVLQKLDELREVSKTFTVGHKTVTYTFDVKTYVLGVGLSDEAKSNLDDMAVHGGTAVANKAYYADHPDELLSTLSTIFVDILQRTASGTSISILSERAQQGANILQAVFYPGKQFVNSEISWLGYLYNWWFYVSKTKSNLREDTNQDLILELGLDYGLTFTFDEVNGLTINRSQDVNKDGDPEVPIDTVTLDETHPIWEAGYRLFSRSSDDRTIYTVDTSDNRTEFTSGNRASFSSLLGSVSSLPGCLTGASDNATWTNLINYVRGTDVSGCRNRTVQISAATNAWKLGDIVYSTPKILSDYRSCYKSDNQTFSADRCASAADCTAPLYTECRKSESVAYVGANDGMLHAFKMGVLSNEGLDTDNGTVAKLIGSDLGKELWAFIPKNSLPYLRCLANPAYCHLNYVDLTPYIVDITISGVTRKVLIGGMRLGGAACEESGGIYKCGAPTDTCPSMACASLDTCYSPGTCTGLSSYYALDVSDPYNPVFLWEFTHPRLGYSYSGPAVIKRGDTYYVMFLSGPTTRDGGSNQNLYSFVLTLDVDLAISDLYVYDFGSSIKNAFGGRLFTTGLDMNNDGNTEFVFFGYSSSATGNIDDWKGGIVKLWTGDANTASAPAEPRSWDFNTSYFNAAQQPVTAKIGVGKCFNRWYVFAGSGRYFYKADQYSVSQNDWVMAVPFVCSATNDDCTGTINFGHSSTENICSSLDDSDKMKFKGWYEELDPAEDPYFKERNVTDPTVTEQSIVYFTTTEPTSEVCGYGGRTRMWAFNCATGKAIFDSSCASRVPADTSGTLYLQTSTGAITKISPGSSFTEEGGRATDWIDGVPPETATPLIPPAGMPQGRIIQWIEK